MGKENYEKYKKEKLAKQKAQEMLTMIWTAIET